MVKISNINCIFKTENCEVIKIRLMNLRLQYSFIFSLFSYKKYTILEFYKIKIFLTDENYAYIIRKT